MEVLAIELESGSLRSNESFLDSRCRRAGDKESSKSNVATHLDSSNESQCLEISDTLDSLQVRSSDFTFVLYEIIGQGDACPL